MEAGQVEVREDVASVVAEALCVFAATPRFEQVDLGPYRPVLPPRIVDLLEHRKASVGEVHGEPWPILLLLKQGDLEEHHCLAAAVPDGAQVGNGLLQVGSGLPEGTLEPVHLTDLP
jgi:hypothetical protein